MRGCLASELPSYLDEFMWRERFGTTAGAAFRSIMADIAAFYPV
jgi:nitrate/nitrite transporter NarK